MIMAVNYASKYSQNVDERFSTGSLTNGIVNGEFDWIGVSTVNVYSIPTSAMNDYSLSGTNRYGTPEELGNETQEMTLKQDRCGSDKRCFCTISSRNSNCYCVRFY